MTRDQLNALRAELVELFNRDDSPVRNARPVASLYRGAVAVDATDRATGQRVRCTIEPHGARP